MLFSPGKKMAIIMLLTILILSLLLASFTKEGMETAETVNQDAPTQEEGSSPVGVQLPDGKKPMTVDEIKSILGKNQAVKDLLK